LDLKKIRVENGEFRKKDNYEEKLENVLDMKNYRRKRQVEK